MIYYWLRYILAWILHPIRLEELRTVEEFARVCRSAGCVDDAERLDRRVEALREEMGL